eukprot:CAMPEP_0117472290 /NCGR_PEP_ID=MMETSP0784-20121206/8169_1 /TAXON_ID=39447 /ORGANISM="" /LENGTH=146 /DNA_ID=CAMNT_0005266433 /DNA_START=42 /DNA_END=482 /DNA_ORIENTATION=-
MASDTIASSSGSRAPSCSTLVAETNAAAAALSVPSTTPRIGKRKTTTSNDNWHTIPKELGTTIHASQRMKPQRSHRQLDATPTTSKGKLMDELHLVFSTVGNAVSKEQAPTTLHTEETRPQKKRARSFGNTSIAAICKKANVLTAL